MDINPGETVTVSFGDNLITVTKTVKDKGYVGTIQLGETVNEEKPRMKKSKILKTVLQTARGLHAADSMETEVLEQFELLCKSPKKYKKDMLDEAMEEIERLHGVIEQANKYAEQLFQEMTVHRDKVKELQNQGFKL